MAMNPRWMGGVAAAGLAICTAWASATGVIADKVILRDGTIYLGTVVSNTARMVEIETTISNIKATIKIEKWRVREIIVTDDPADEAPVRDPAPTAGQAQGRVGEAIAEKTEVKSLKRDGFALVLEVPMIGGFGDEIYPKGIAVALEWAVEHGVTDVVFRIDSGGGAVWVANAIVEIMERHEDDLRYHGVIESAISASIWPMFECDTLSMVPGSQFGGAVVYSKASTGSLEVDKKMNSIMQAKLASSAEAKGHDGAIVRAMMISENEVWKYRRQGTSMPWKITDIRENATAPGMEFDLIDTDQEIMTLTARQADEYGVASLMADDTLESFATVVQLGPWDNAGSFGFDAVEEWSTKARKLNDRLMTKRNSLMIELSRFDKNTTLGGAGLIVNTSRRMIADIKRLLRQAEGMEMDTIVDAIGGSDLEQAEIQIDRVQAEIRRIRNGP